MDFSPAHLLHTLQGLPGASRYWVAYSGGVDSHVLLHALVAARAHWPRGALGAVHVHHGLQPEADGWAEHCVATCQALGVPCVVRVVAARPGTGESPEAAARRARYAALAEVVGAGEAVLTAHHRDDQAETLLLQLLRGAGVRGLAAMPRQALLGQGWLGRPLLAVSRAALCHYAEAQGLVWVEDPSNRDLNLDRNYLRHHLMPLLSARWPACTHTLSRAATHQAEAADLLDTLGETDLAAVAADHLADSTLVRPATPRLADCSVPDVGHATTLSISALRRLTPARQRNALRYWLRGNGLPIPATVVLSRIQNEVLPARSDAAPCVTWPGGAVRRYRDALYGLRVAPAPGAPVHRGGGSMAVPVSSPPVSSLAPIVLGRIDMDKEIRTQWPLEGVQTLVVLPTGRLVVRGVVGRGLSRARLVGRRVELRFRHGGELCRPQGRGHRHSLKKLFQEWGVPPWQRGQIPLVYVDGALVQVIGYCLCDPYAARAHELGCVFGFEPSGSSADR